MANIRTLSDGNATTTARALEHHAGLGFRRRLDLNLWLIFGGIMAVFSVIHVELISVEGMRKRLVPGQWFWYQEGFYQYAMQLHLMTTLPSSFLFAFQFIPYIRNNYRRVHRASGRIAFTLMLIGAIGGTIISRHAMGGAVSTQTASLTLTTMTVFTAFKAWQSIRSRRVDEHRKWSFRCAFYMGSIVSVRVIMVLSSFIASTLGSYYTIFRCDELDFIMASRMASKNISGPSLEVKYPACRAMPSAVVPVRASFYGTYEELVSVLRLSFGAAMWLALIIHAIGVECYLNSSPSASPASRAR